MGRLFVVLLLSAGLAAADERDPFVGRWEIQVKFPEGRLAPLLIVELGRGEEGLSGKVVASVMPGLPALRDVALQDGQLRFVVEIGAAATFRARRVGDRLEGQAEIGSSRTDWIGVITTRDRIEPPPMPADQLAFTGALRMRDADEKRAALEKFLADFPKSPLRGRAYLQLLDDLLRATPLDEAKLSALIDRRVGEASESDRPTEYNNIADRLMSADLMLDRALDLIQKAVAATSEQTPARMRAMFLTTLGQVRYKRKEYDAAADSLSKAIALGAAESSEAELYLGKVHEARGNVDAALEAYLKAAASGMGPELRTSLERTYTRKHGSLEGLHEKLDAAIEARPKLFEAGRYAPPAGAPGRVVLAELFTGAECRPCLAADLAFDGVIERFPRAAVAVVEYHLHIPGPDPMTNTDSEQRSRYYSVRAAPSVFFDGVSGGMGGGLAPAAANFFGMYRQKIEGRLGSPPAARFASLALRRDGKSVTLSGELALDPAARAQLDKSRLRLVLAQEVVHYTGGNGIHFHRFVARQMVGSAEGLKIDGAGGTMAFSQTVALEELEATLRSYLDSVESKRSGFQWRERPATVEPGSVAVVAFVQNDETKEVLQAAFAK